MMETLKHMYRLSFYAQEQSSFRSWRRAHSQTKAQHRDSMDEMHLPNFLHMA